MKDYIVVYLVRGKPYTSGQVYYLESAIKYLKNLKRRGWTAWIEDTNGNFISVTGTKRKPSHL